MVGRDRAYSLYLHASGLGRCSFEVPYPANPFASIARQPVGRRRRWLLHFRGSLDDVCCEPGRSVRQAVRALLQPNPNNEGMRGRLQTLLQHAMSYSSLRSRVRNLVRLEDLNLVDMARNWTEGQKQKAMRYRLQGEEARG